MVTDDDTTATLERGNQAVQRGRFKEAFEIADGLIKRFPDDPRGWHLLSNANMSAGRLPEAARCIKQALRLRPKEAAYRVQLGRCFAMAGRRNEAIEAVTEAERLEPMRAPLLDGIGANELRPLAELLETNGIDV